MADPVPTTVPTPIRLGYNDYLVLPDDGRRYEIIEGDLAVSPAPRPFHQTVSRRIQFALYARELAGDGQVFDAPVDLLLTPHDILQLPSRRDAGARPTTSNGPGTSSSRTTGP